VPIKYATNGNIPVDVFVVITDSETWAGPMHSSVALQLYRKKMSINAGLMAIGMTATKFSMADASDPKQVDVAGFDTSVPEVLRWLALS
jgi:60 kDa SS-A/Ro ribonucleoprotein